MCYLSGGKPSCSSSLEISLKSLTSLAHLYFSVEIDAYNYELEVKLVDFPLSLESLSLRGLALSYSEE